MADSFEGFAPSETARENGVDLAAYDFLAAPLEDVQASFARLGYEQGVEFVPGFFEDSLGRLSGRRWALVRLDADAYEPTRDALHALYPGLVIGGYLVVDDYGLFEGCRRAVEDESGARTQSASRSSASTGPGCGGASRPTRCQPQRNPGSSAGPSCRLRPSRTGAATRTCPRSRRFSWRASWPRCASASRPRKPRSSG